MSKRRGFASARSQNAAQWLAIGGLLLIVIASTFKFDVAKVSIDSLTANVGALILIVGILQWLFDTRVRNSFFQDVRSEIIDNRQVVESGISGFYEDSKEVDYGQDFIDSNRCIIGVNYSTKLVDASLGQLEKRSQLKKETQIFVVREGSAAWRFMAEDFNNPDMAASVTKLKAMAHDLDENDQLAVVKEVNTLLRYSFILFDNRAWVIVGTHGSGRRAVPGFFVRAGSPWFRHIENDIERLTKRTQPESGNGAT